MSLLVISVYQSPGQLIDDESETAFLFQRMASLAAISVDSRSVQN